MADPADLFHELNDALEAFKAYIDPASATGQAIKQAVGALDTLHVPIKDLLTKLITLMQQLKQAVSDIDPASIPGLADVAKFAKAVTDLLNAAKVLLPGQSAEIQDVLDTAGAVTALPSLADVKQAILDNLTVIITDLGVIKGS
jgi:ABC-type transporter Mla subunit MlaD